MVTLETQGIVGHLVIPVNQVTLAIAEDRGIPVLLDIVECLATLAILVTLENRDTLDTVELAVIPGSPVTRELVVTLENPDIAE